ncbi:MAG: magnesium transporter MgtE N-terminal domain-containing protein [Desulfobacterales bacterium]
MNPESQTLASSLAADFFKRYPHDAAERFEQLPDAHALDILNSMTVADAALLLRLINPALAAILVKDVSNLGEISQILDPAYLACIFSRLDTETRSRCLDRLPEPVRNEIVEVLKYPEGTAGSLMTTRVVSFHPDDEIETVISRIRRLKAKNLTLIYLVDIEGRLLGRVLLQDIIGAEDHETLQSLSRPTPKSC